MNLPAAIALAAAALLALAALASSLRRARAALRRTPAALLALAAACCIYGGSKGRVTVDDPYISDAGSWLTNDVAHVAIAKRTPLLPDGAEILVYARPADSTNAADWVRLSPFLTFADHPHDYALPGATNCHVLVSAGFAPAPAVHTNGVWQIKGFAIPETGRAAFPNTKILSKGETP